MGVSSKNNIGAKVKGAWLGYIWMLSYTIENEFDWKDQYGDSWWITGLQKKILPLLPSPPWSGNHSNKRQ